MTGAIGLILVITGLVLAVWFAQVMFLDGPTPAASYIVAAIALAMLSVGARYLFRTTRPQS